VRGGAAPFLVVVSPRAPLGGECASQPASEAEAESEIPKASFLPLLALSREAHLERR